MKNRFIKLFITAILLLSALLMTVSCQVEGNPPELYEVKDRFVWLIEQSKEFNTLFFGAGLPKYERESLLAERKMIYGFDSPSGYDFIMENASFHSSSEIRASAERIFSEKYLSSVFETVFDGVMIGANSAYLRFFEDDKGFYQNSLALDYKLSERIYDYSSMKIISPSSANYVKISIESYSLSDQKESTVCLSFVYENGNWFLDSPTY